MEKSVRPDQPKTEIPVSVIHPLIRRPRHKWFSCSDRECDDGWWGAHKTVEAAARECYCNNGSERIFVAQGRRLRQDEMYSECTWKVDAANAFEIILPKVKGQRPGESLKTL